MTSFPYFLALALAIAALVKLYYYSHRKCPVAVNYHFTRRCNKTCGFCFHTASTSYIEQPDRAKRGLLLLKRAGMRKINFAGGEPFLYSKFLGEMIDFCKEELRLESVSIVTNPATPSTKLLTSRLVGVQATRCHSYTKLEHGVGDMA
jgi:radical S-adenosyl methionine domain-containing protein 2